MVRGILRMENSAYPPRADMFVLDVETVLHTPDAVVFVCIYRGDSLINFNLYEMMSFKFFGEEYRACTLEGCGPWKLGKGLVFRISVKEGEKTMEHRRVATSYANRAFEPSYRLDISRILVNGPATIVWWNDGTKTVVKISEDDIKDNKFDVYTAVAYALAEKHFGTNSAFKRKVARKSAPTDKFFPKEDTNHDHA